VAARLRFLRMTRVYQRISSRFVVLGSQLVGLVAWAWWAFVEIHVSHLSHRTRKMGHPACDEWIRVAHSYWYAVSGLLTAMLICGFVCVELGAGGAPLVLYALFVWVPIFFLMVFWKMHFLPPRLKRSSPWPDDNGLGLYR
jgi:hypothetical protein